MMIAAPGVAMNRARTAVSSAVGFAMPIVLPPPATPLARGKAGRIADASAPGACTRAARSCHGDARGRGGASTRPRSKLEPDQFVSTGNEASLQQNGELVPAVEAHVPIPVPASPARAFATAATTTSSPAAFAAPVAGAVHRAARASRVPALLALVSTPGRGTDALASDVADALAHARGASAGAVARGTLRLRNTLARSFSRADSGARVERRADEQLDASPAAIRRRALTAGAPRTAIHARRRVARQHPRAVVRERGAPVQAHGRHRDGGKDARPHSDMISPHRALLRCQEGVPGKGTSVPRRA